MPFVSELSPEQASAVDTRQSSVMLQVYVNGIPVGDSLRKFALGHTKVVCKVGDDLGERLLFDHEQLIADVLLVVPVVIVFGGSSAGHLESFRLP